MKDYIGSEVLYIILKENTFKIQFELFIKSSVYILDNALATYLKTIFSQ